MTRIFYDAEFLEDGERIRLISIGMVREDGAEYYAVSDEATRRPLNGLIRKHEWLMANVVPSLPKAPGDARLYQPRRWLFNYSDPCVKPRHVIAREVRDFILAGPDPELWADYGAYDHVVLCQVWGRMTDLPEGIPMWTHDLRQEWDRAGRPAFPALVSGREHNALHDAREVMARYDWLTDRAARPPSGPAQVKPAETTVLDRLRKAARAIPGGDVQKVFGGQP